MHQRARTAELIRTYLAAIEAGDLDGLVACLDPTMGFEELPNKVSPRGSRRDVAEIRSSFAKGLDLLEHQRYEVVSLVEVGGRVIAEVRWSGQVRGGPMMRAASAMFFEVRGGRIVRQRNYDCFEP